VKTLTMLAEAWRPCPGFEGWYEVSDLGRVKRVKAGRGTHVGKIQQPAVCKNGDYLYVTLHTMGKAYPKAVSRLVALAFLPNPLNLPEVNHKKGKEKWNNAVDNLEWSTRSENMQHAFGTGLFGDRKGENHTQARLTWEQVAEIRGRHIPGRNGNAAALAKEYGVSYSHIWGIATGRTWKEETK
jgi:hypothetical protein